MTDFTDGNRYDARNGVEFLCVLYAQGALRSGVGRQVWPHAVELWRAGCRARAAAEWGMSPTHRGDATPDERERDERRVMKRQERAERRAREVWAGMVDNGMAHEDWRVVSTGAYVILSNDTNGRRIYVCK